MSIDYSSQLGKKITTRGNKKFCLHIESILYILCEGDFSTLFLNNHTRVHEIKPLKAYEEELCDMGFIRISRNTLINGKYITKIINNSGKRMVYLGDDIVLHISKRRLNEVKRVLY